MINSTIDARDVYKKINSADKDFILLDVRTPQEYSSQKILGSINIPLDNLSEDIEKIVTNKNTIIYVYCLSGSRSSEAVNIMKKLGYINAYEILNGLLAWRFYQLPLEK